MDIKYKKFKINQGDKLEILSQKLGLKIDEMIGFHNIFAKEDDFIMYDLPKHLEELYVYPYIYDNIKDTRLKVQLAPNHKLAHLPKKGMLNYGVMYFITSGEEEISMKYEISVSYLKKDTIGLYFEIDKISPTYINDEEANTIADEVAEKVSATLYPLTVIVDEDGKWFGIANFKEIKNRWEKVKDTIYNDFEGSWITDYIQECENNLTDENTFLFSLKDNWFLNAYFGGIYIYYRNSFSFDKSVAFPVLTEIADLQYTAKYNLQELLNEEDIIKIDVAGFLDDARSKEDFENKLNFPYQSLENQNTNKATGNYNAKYYLNTITQSIKSMMVECTINLDVPQKIKIIIASIN